MPPETSDIQLPVTNLQAEVLGHPARYRVWIAGRRSAKSYTGVLDCVDTAANIRGSLSWYIAPTLDDARELGWEPLKEIVPPDYVWTTNETRLVMLLKNESRIVMKSADRPERLRGRGVHKAVFDEFRWMDPIVWPTVRPALSTTGGRVLFITSPFGYDWAYDFYLRGMGGDPRWKRWKSWQTTTLQAGLVSPEEIEEARAELDPRMFRQEYEASFETLEGRVYSQFLRSANVQSVEDTGGELLIGMDFNVHPMTAVVAVAAGDECHVIDALELPSSNTEEMVAELNRRYPDRAKIACPDPTGNSRKSSAPVGQTDFTILQRGGFQIDAPRAGLPPVDRINNVNAMLLAADTRRRLLIHPKAVALIKALDGLTYKPGSNFPDKSGGLDHITDALGYLLWARFNLLQNRRVEYRPFLMR